MSNSGQKINYSLRPAKNIERKMLRDLFARLSPISSVSDYLYIGFGAKYFTDFSLFHKSLHINRMISIEQDHNNRSRYLFNKPFKCIQMEFGKSSDVLPRIDLDSTRSITWLDYDDEISPAVFQDVSILLKRVLSGSVLTISFNSTPYRIGNLRDEYRDISSGYYHRKLKSLVGHDWLVPIEDDMQGMGQWSVYSRYLKGCVDKWIDKKLEERNNTLGDTEKLHKFQIAYFDYADGAKMSTISYVLLNAADRMNFDLCKLSDYDFFRDEDDSYLIKPPNLTLKEIKSLMSLFPLDEGEDGADLWDPNIFNAQDVESLQETYKYFPNYAEIEG